MIPFDKIYLGAVTQKGPRLVPPEEAAEAVYNFMLEYTTACITEAEEAMQLAEKDLKEIEKELIALKKAHDAECANYQQLLKSFVQ